MTYYLGVDAGGSSTRAAVCDASGTIISRGSGGPANYLHTDRHLLIDSLTTALCLALPPRFEIAATCIGMAGLGRQSEWQAARHVLKAVSPLFDDATVTHDARIAWAGGIALSPGIILVSGTGSIAYGVDDEGKEYRAGGYGPHYSDEGSGFSMGRQALSRCLRVADGRSEHSLMVDLVCQYLGAADPQELAAGVASSRLSRQEISRLPGVIALAQRSGDHSAGAIITSAAADLGDVIVAVAKQAGFAEKEALKVALCGGTIKAVPELAMLLADTVERRLPGATIVPAALSPLGGALLMAISARGLTITHQVIDNLRASGEGGF